MTHSNPAQDGIDAARLDDEMREIRAKHPGDLTSEDLRAIMHEDLTMMSKDDVVSAYVTSMDDEDLEGLRNSIADDETPEPDVSVDWKSGPEEVVEQVNSCLEAHEIGVRFVARESNSDSFDFIMEQMPPS